MKVKQLVHNVRVTVTPNTLKTCCKHVQTVVILPNLDKRWDMRPHKGHGRVTVPKSVSMKSQMSPQEPLEQAQSQITQIQLGPHQG